jgi:rfaE bifunctional protein kinase chain/domain
MTPERFREITDRYPGLTLGLVGDFCLDRYLEIDPHLAETSIETGLPVHNVTRVRSQPGGAGTILNNLVALGAGRIHCVGFCGDDGEGYELRRALATSAGAVLDGFLRTPRRSTFTYAKPLVRRAYTPPVELNRLDIKNWSPTPPDVEADLCRAIESIADSVDAWILLDQTDLVDTGVLTRRVRQMLGDMARGTPDKPFLADCRRGLSGWPPFDWKMNMAELARLTGRAATFSTEAQQAALELARINQRPVFVTMSEWGIVGACPDGRSTHVPAFPKTGPIDVVGAGDSVTANLAVALAAGATAEEAMEIAMPASNIVVHQLGTTGTASVAQIARLLFPSR